MTPLDDTKLVVASVHRGAPFREAARVLAEHELAAIAVLDDDRRVVGLFTGDDLLRGIFPAYLEELKHTAFLQLDADALAAKLEEAGDEPVARHMRKPVTVGAGTSAAHLAERFLHNEAGALAVVDRDERFVGMVGQVEFCRSIMRRLD